MKEPEKTLGQVVAERRSALGLTLRDAAQLVHKEDGHGISSQYLHDIERDKRVPAPHTLDELARALGVGVHYLEAVAGRCPAGVARYLRERPDAAPAVAALFARARATGFADWDLLVPHEGAKKATR